MFFRVFSLFRSRKKSAIVLALTFLGVLYNGGFSQGGSGLFSNMRGSFFSAFDITSGFIAVVRGIRTMQEVLNAAVEEDCSFSCPTGEHAVQNPEYVPRSNGCGSFGVDSPEVLAFQTVSLGGLLIDDKNLPTDELTRCCDFHDMCYDTCGAIKTECDLKFQTCLYRICENYETMEVNAGVVKACKGSAKLLYTGTNSLGCKSYSDSQEAACMCVPDTKRKLSRKERRREKRREKRKERKKKRNKRRR